MTSIRFLRPVDNVKNCYTAEVDGIEMTIYTRDGQDPKEAIKETFNIQEPNYMEKRLQEYPSIQDQLDMIYHDIDSWKAKISAIKAKYPK